MKRVLLIAMLLGFVASPSCILSLTIQCIDNTECGPPRSCQNGKCTCPPNLPDSCSRACADLKVDPKNCGVCGNECSGDKPNCIEGSCTDQGCDGQKVKKDLCGGSCVDKKTDPRHCGACNTECKNGESCIDGKCECKGKKCDGVACVDLQTNPKHCGDCTTKCKEGQICTQGSCGNCPNDDNQKICEGLCIQISESPDHCGACNNNCKANDPTKSDCCGGKCIDLQTNNAHCGECGNVCPSNATCVAGKCKCPKTSQSTCKDPNNKNQLTCVDLLTNDKFCGSCETSCKAEESCQKGQCCANPKLLCGAGDNASCVDPRTNPNHCGECDKSCNGKICKSGKCSSCSDDNDCKPLKCDKDSGKCLCKRDCYWARILTKVAEDDLEVLKAKVTTDTGQNVYVALTFKGKGSLKFGDKQLLLTAEGTTNAGIIKFSPGGEPLWSKVFQGQGKSEINDLAWDTKNKRLIAVGQFQEEISFGSKKLKNTGKIDFFLAAISPEKGKEIWLKGSNHKENETIKAVVVGKQGDLFVTGEFQSNLKLVSTLKGAPKDEGRFPYTLFAAKFDETGTPKQAVSLEAESSGTAIALNKDQTKLFVGGHLSSAKLVGSQALISSGAQDLFIGRLPLNGQTWKWEWGANSKGAAPVSGIVVTKKGEVYIAGTGHDGTSFRDEAKTFVETCGGYRFNGYIIKLVGDKFEKPEFLKCKKGSPANSYIIVTGLKSNGLGTLALIGHYRGLILDGGGTTHKASSGEDGVFTAFKPPNSSRFVTNVAFQAKGKDIATGVALAADQSTYVVGTFEQEFKIPTLKGKETLTSGSKTPSLFVWKAQ